MKFKTDTENVVGDKSGDYERKKIDVGDTSGDNEWLIRTINYYLRDTLIYHKIVY